MNKTRMLEMADFLDTLPRSKFRMGWWFDSSSTEAICEADALKPRCGTTCCVGGWVVLHSGKCLSEKEYVLGDVAVVDKRGRRIDNVEDYAQAYLGLSGYQARMLFHQAYWPYVVAHPIDEQARNATPKDAAKVIRWMVEHEKTID